MTATSTAAASIVARAATPRLPGAWRVGLCRGRVELKAFFRERQAVVFIFALPAVMLVLLGAIFSSQSAGQGVTIGDLYVAGLIGGGVMATSYQNLGMSIAFERERFTLKRLRGTPMPPAAYFAGKIIQVFVAAVAEVAVLLAVGLVCFTCGCPRPWPPGGRSPGCSCSAWPAARCSASRPAACPARRPATGWP